MTEETNQDAPAAAVVEKPPIDPPADVEVPTLQPPAETILDEKSTIAESGTVMTGGDTSATDTAKNTDVDPQDPLVVAEDEAELARIAEEQRVRALEGDISEVEKGTDTAGDPAPTTPYVAVGNRVWLRGANEPVAMTVALVTKVLEDGVVNVTAFFDGEVPRPLAGVPFGSNAGPEHLGWFPN